jgi:hypothetical protein
MVNVFLDLDGVLGAFDEHVEALWGAGPRELGDVKLWELVSGHPPFWIDSPLKPGAQELFDVAAPYNPTILTGCPTTGFDHAVEQKRLWIDKHFGTHVPVIACLSRDKPLHMTQPKDILVDDFIVNIKRWQKAGGTTVWYQTADQAIADLKRKLENARVREETLA